MFYCLFYYLDIPELQTIVSGVKSDNDKELIQLAFREVLTCPQEKIQDLIDSLLTRFSELSKYLMLHPHMDTRLHFCLGECERGVFSADLVERLHSQFPYDNGILMVYFLNYLKLKPSEAIFLGANEPHAYLFGGKMLITHFFFQIFNVNVLDCVECMACSDNVVRAGLTPKFIDVDTLCSMLIYDGAPPENKLYSPICEDEFSVIFRPPVPDFAVVQIQVFKKLILSLAHCNVLHTLRCQSLRGLTQQKNETAPVFYLRFQDQASVMEQIFHQVLFCLFLQITQ